MANPWEAEAGSYQGRIAPTDGPPIEGSFVYQFGHDLPAMVRQFMPGDYHDIFQTGDITGITVLRPTLRVRAPAVLAGTNTYFLFTLIVAGDVLLQVAIRAGDAPITYTDLVASFFGFSPGSYQMHFVLDVHSDDVGPFDLEMPSVVLDELVEDTASYDPGICNRLPQPGDTDVPGDTAITFNIFATGADIPDDQNTTVFVNGAVAYQAGIFQPGWAAFFSSTSVPFPGMLGFFLIPDTSPFDSEAVITVRVQSAVVGGPSNALDVTWSFTIADTTPPQLVSAFAVDASHVLLTFNEDVTQLDPLVVGDALHAGSYSLAVIAGTPAVTPVVEAVLPGVSGEQVTLVLADELTNHATYRVTVLDVTDVHANIIVAPNNTADFIALTCTPPVGRDSDLLRRIPQLNRDIDLKRTQDLRKFLGCMQVVYEELLCDVDHWTDILDPETAPEVFVDAMLADLGNPFAFPLTLVEKQNLIVLLIPLYQEKGTDEGMVDAIRILLGLEVTVQVLNNEGIWSLGDSELGEDTVLGSSILKDIYSFDIVSLVSLTPEQRKKITSIVAYMRRAPTHLRFIIEPDTSFLIIDHWELGLSELAEETILHL